MILKCLFSISLFSICFVCVTKAQTNKGSIFLGGNLSFQSVKNKIDIPQEDLQKQRTIIIQPTIGKAIKDNLVAGFSFGFSYLNSDNIANTIATKSTQYTASLFLRKYMLLGAGFSLFGQADLYLLHEKLIYNRDIETESRTGPTIGFSLYPGLSYSMSKNLQLEAGFNQVFNINYTHENRVLKSRDNVVTAKSAMNYFGVQSSLNNIANFTLGFRLLISKK